jgi:hypothetical protein
MLTYADALRYFVDLHAHATKRGAFCYANALSTYQEQVYIQRHTDTPTQTLCASATQTLFRHTRSRCIYRDTPTHRHTDTDSLCLCCAKRSFDIPGAGGIRQHTSAYVSIVVWGHAVVLILLYMSSYYYMCVLILLYMSLCYYMCPHTTTYVSLY